MERAAGTQPPLGAVACFNLKLAPAFKFAKENQHSGYRSFAYSAWACFRMGRSELASNNESPNLHPVFLRHRRDNTIQAQVLDKLSVVVGDVPDGNDRDA